MLPPAELFPHVVFYLVPVVDAGLVPDGALTFPGILIGGSARAI